MPQATRKSEATTQRAQDKEQKRARGALSCAECRRLKLKCDKTVPCSSCKRRGCSAICPNGSLITGQGTRFVLADTEKLHAKIAQMSDRIRQLEDALAILWQSTNNGNLAEAHPLLSRDLLKVKSSIELHAAIETNDLPQSSPIPEETEESQNLDAFGTLAIRDDGAATFYGRSAGSESLLIGEAASPSSGGAANAHSPEWQRDPSLASLSSAFPLAATVFSPGVSIDYFITHYLPTYQEACRLSQLYLESGPWFFGPVTRRQLEEEILPLWYEDAPRPVTPNPSVADKGGAHDLALLFIIFCFGALTDMALPPAPDNPACNQYYQLTKAALNLEPVLERPPSVATVQTLSMMAIYEGLSSGENSIESTWALMGLATKLAQSIGLHRDCARWKLSPAEVQKRRGLFWELFITDCWQSLATGRLATFSLPFVDCELPGDPDQTIAEDGTVQPSFPFWKARFGAECVAAVVHGTLTSRAPKYSIILELDRKVRDMELPLYAQGPPPQGLGLAQTMSHFMPINYRELTLLYIHRCFFAHAISSSPLDPIKSTYAPSFLAGYRSACTIVHAVQKQFILFPAQIARFWVLWTHAFSASVMLASVATHSSKSKAAPAALIELKTACDMFEQAASYGGRAVKFLPILKRLQSKAQQAFRDTNSGIPATIFSPTKQEEADELSIFSGKTHTVQTSTKPSAGSPRTTRNSPQSRNAVASSSRASSGSPQQSFTDNPSFAGVHPSLVSELHGFDGQIKKQIESAYQANTDAFGSAMLVDHPHREPISSEQELNRQHFQRELERQERERRKQADQQRQQHLSMNQPSVQIPQHTPPQNYQQYPPQASSSSHAANSSNHQHQSRPTHPRASSSRASSLNQPYPQNYPASHPHHMPPGPGHAPQLYPMSPDYSQSGHSSVSSPVQYTPPGTSYGPPPSASPYTDAPQAPVPPVSNPYPGEQYQYWSQTNNGYIVQEQQAPYPPSQQQPYPAAHHAHVYQPNMPAQYTPEAAMRGIAADDRSLQETWQSYMYKVGSPRHLLED
ncbi:fungal-specific transcription factor domain-containing protein [Cyathus striatus]|nr:fungal-specific transcription factor domain-containing protein [Cyathus striatus]